MLAVLRSEAQLGNEDGAKQRASADSFASSGRPAPRAFDTLVLAPAAIPLPSMKTQVCVLNAIPMLPRETSGSGNKPAHRAGLSQVPIRRAFTPNDMQFQRRSEEHVQKPACISQMSLGKHGSDTAETLRNVTGLHAHRQNSV